MCGIAGIASPESLADRGVLLAMRDSMVHRGPDAEGAWWSADGRVGLAHRRLAIIDLSEAGRQPMVGPSGHTWLTFNGEIYNYQELRRQLEGEGVRFRTRTDSEVILAAYETWGLARALRSLNGMFAFALYDEAAQGIYLARDRAGEKPLFYRHHRGRLAFASELKALFADPAMPREVDPEALDHYLAYGYVPGSLCMVRGVRKLPPAHSLWFDLRSGRLVIDRYWTPPRQESTGATLDELTGRMEQLLTDAVRRQLHADVPVGILLSGGLDSSLVTAIAARVSSQPVRTFNVSFRGHAAHDESPHARLVASHFGTEHTELIGEPASVDLLPMLARQYDEPIGDSSMVPTFMVSRAIRREATVALGGDGADELFGGYPHYNGLHQTARLHRRVPRLLRRVIGASAGAIMPRGSRGRTLLSTFGGTVADAICHVNMYFDADWRAALLRPLVSGTHEWTARAEDFRRDLCDPSADVIAQSMKLDFATFLPDDVLVKVDRASMLTSLEVRAPFLDAEILDFAFGSVPLTAKANDRDRKIILRRLAARVLPPAFDAVRKQGFVLPLQGWSTGAWGDFITDTVRAADSSWLDPHAVAALIDGQQRGYANGNRLFAIAMLELWRREYRIQPPSTLAFAESESDLAAVVHGRPYW
jgi:asparagine synthase (glutamine-hydrolysing)